MQSCLLFDLDGTLIDSTSAILESFNVVFKKNNLQKPHDNIIKSFIGYPLEEIFLYLGVEPKIIDSCVLQYKEHYKKISIEQTFLLKDAKEALSFANSFSKIGIVTTKSSISSIQLLKSLDVYKYIKIVVGRDDVTNPKPNKEPIVKAMSILGANKDSTWMIGDTKLDLISANESGVKSVGVLCGYSEKNILKKYTPHICNTSYDAVKHINDLLIKK